MYCNSAYLFLKACHPPLSFSPLPHPLFLLTSKTQSCFYLLLSSLPLFLCGCLSPCWQYIPVPHSTHPVSSTQHLVDPIPLEGQTFIWLQKPHVLLDYTAQVLSDHLLPFSFPFLFFKPVSWHQSILEHKMQTHFQSFYAQAPRAFPEDLFFSWSSTEGDLDKGWRYFGL